MPQYTSIAIATIFALVGFLPLAGRGVRRPLLWLTLIAGGAVGYLAREGTQVIVELLSQYLDFGADLAALFLIPLVAAAVGELMKATPALIAVSIGSTDEATGLGYGAASGAGFGAVVTWPVLAMSLQLLGSPFITPLSAGVAIGGWFFRILGHIVTTAYVARAGVTGGLGGALLAALIIQFVLALTERLQLVSGIQTGVLVAAVISLAMFAYLWRIRARAASAAVGS